MNRSRLSLAAACACVFVASLSALPAAAADVPPEVVAGITAGKGPAVYLVVLAGDPVVAYQGELPGLAATSISSSAGRTARNPDAVAAYVSHLTDSHDRVLADVGVAPEDKLYDYTHTVNGFAARLTAASAVRMAARSDVVAVVADEVMRTAGGASGSGSTATGATDNSPDYLELSHQQGPWAAGYTGEGVVVGVIDTGIWPEHPSFAGDGYGPAPATFGGAGCDFGAAVADAAGVDREDFLDDADYACGGKLLAAKVYGLGLHGGVGDGLADDEYLSARDGDGHGSHTAAVAAGNRGVPASVLGAEWGTVSGMAPRALLSVYKACWRTGPGPGRCALSDVVAAIDDAVADGVDVINLSMGSGPLDGPVGDRLGPADLSLLYADAAGVVVAASAGNAGPGAASVGSPAATPWVTAVGAASTDRRLGGTVILGDETAVSGVTVTGGSDVLALVDAADIGNETCDPEVEFAEPVTGAMVLCHGDPAVAPLAAGLAVAEQGGAAMVLADLGGSGSLRAANHHVPTLHVSAKGGAAVAEYIDGAEGDAVATLSGGLPMDADDSVMAPISGRGPNRLSADIIKPDVVAPGVDILAAHSPTATGGAVGVDYRVVSGTSAAGAHVAGAYALLRQAHPDWTPAMSRSALSTSARRDVRRQNGTTPADAFDMGSGYIRPGGIIARRGSAFNPGLVYDARVGDHLGFICGAGLSGTWSAGTCDRLVAAGVATDPSDLNLPSIAVAELTGSQTITRTVTSVADKTRTFESQVRAPAGFSVEVTPSTMTLDPGESARFSVTITRTRAPHGQWSAGALTWSAAGYRVASPIVVRAAELVAPEELDVGGSTGAASFPVVAGYDGVFDTVVYGPVAAETEVGTVDEDPDGDINTALASGSGVSLHSLPVAEGTGHVRLSLFDDTTEGDADLDLYVFGPDGSFIAGSGSPTSAEQVDFSPTAPGDHLVVVHGWHADDPGTEYTLFSWSVPTSPSEGEEGAVEIVAPERAESGVSGTLSLRWSVPDGSRHLGAVSHRGGPHDGDIDRLGLTLVSIDASTGGQPDAGATDGGGTAGDGPDTISRLTPIPDRIDRPAR